MATINILLREDIETLGGRGEIVKVKAGYARNYLLPRGFATLATKGNIKQVEIERTFLLKKAAHDQETAQAQADQMQGISLEFERKAGETGTLFGSVTSMDITDALNAKGYEIDRRKVNLKDPIKEVGEYSVSVRLHREVIIEIPVSVKAEGEAVVEKPAKVEKPVETVEESADDTGGSEEGSSEVAGANEEGS